MSDTEYQLREMPALAYAGAEAHLLCMDDGEIYDCRQHPFIDFKRSPPAEICAFMRIRSLQENTW